MKKLQTLTNWKIASLAASILALAFSLGCSNVEQLVQNAEDGEVTIENINGEEITLSSKEDIPDTFPSDIPLPDEIIVTSSISSDDSVTVTIETEMPYDDVLSLYVDYAGKAGYSEVHRMEDEDSIHYSSQKGTERFVFSLQKDLEDNKTVTGALVYSNEPEAGQ